jgi:predicted DNA-binding protein (MmcQ/YjbR family)
MSLDWVRTYCLSLPHATETIQWGNDLVFKVKGKMFTVAALEPGTHCLSFKCTPEQFAELIERPGIIPAPYVARYHWVALERADALRRTELEPLIKQAYQLVWDKLPAKLRIGT